LTLKREMVGLVWLGWLGAVAGFQLQQRPATRMIRWSSVDESDVVRRELAAKASAYEARRRSAAEAATSGLEVPSLESLAWQEFYDGAGGVTECVIPAGTRASVYAIFDETKALAHVGKSRDAAHSLRTILARQPDAAYFFKVFHVAKASKTYLDVVADAWIAGAAVAGNDGGDGQRAWEAPTDVKPLMTPEDRNDFDAAAARGKEALALKKVARRYEADKIAKLKARGFDAAHFQFDPKLKGQGLLDIKAKA